MAASSTSPISLRASRASISPAPDTAGGLGAAGDAEADALIGRAAFVAGRQVAGQQRVAGAPFRGRLAGLDTGAFEAALPVHQKLGQATVGEGHDRFAGTQADDLGHRHRALVLTGELVSDELLRLDSVGRDQIGFGADGMAQRLALGIDDGRHLRALEILDQGSVEVGLDATRERAGEDDDRRAPCQVDELVAEQLHLVRRDRRTPFVDLGLFSRRRVQDRGVGPRLVPDTDEVVEDRLLRQLLDDVGARRSAGEARGDDGLSEALQRAGDVDALAAGHRALFDGPVAPAEPEAGNGQRLVDRGVERDRDDHAGAPAPAWRPPAANDALGCTPHRLANHLTSPCGDPARPRDGSASASLRERSRRRRADARPRPRRPRRVRRRS